VVRHRFRRRECSTTAANARLLDRGRELGRREAWVGTERSNTAARRLYAAAGGVEASEDFVIVEFDLGEAE
jgi:hypothetical protein